MTQLLRRLRTFAGEVRRAACRLIGPSWHRLPNLLGDRCVEWGWVAATLAPGPGHLLDFGPGESFAALAAAEKGYRVTAVDLTSSMPYTHPAVRFIKGDILHLDLEPSSFDVVVNCSAIEHVGLAGRYGVAEARPDGDLEAMAVLRSLLRPGGMMILTVPVGRDAVLVPNCRVYGAVRLPRLLEGLSVEREVFWVKDDDNRWRPAPREIALGIQPRAEGLTGEQTYYGLGCFALRRAAR